MTRSYCFASAILSVGLLTAGYSINNSKWLAVGILVLGINWIIGLMRSWKWSLPAGLFLTFGISTVGLSMNFQPAYMLAGAIFAFLAWDLAEFAGRLRLAAKEDGTSVLERTHIKRVTAIMFIGGGMCALASLVKIKITFEWMVFIMLFGVWGIGQMINWLIARGT